MFIHSLTFLFLSLMMLVRLNVLYEAMFCQRFLLSDIRHDFLEKTSIFVNLWVTSSDC